MDRRIGKFEIADGSTLFLDEIGEMPLELQAKLLRAIQEKEIERLGSNKVIRVDTRIIAATNRDLVVEVRNGKFRSDLFYRLNVFPLTIPPLRERKEDLPMLTNHFIQKMSKKLGKNIVGISNKVVKEMANYEWPGNIRELEHLIERAVLMSQSTIIEDLYLPSERQQAVRVRFADQTLRTLADQEREYILFVLKECRSQIYGPRGAAEVLNIPPSTLQSKMKKLGIKRNHVAG